MPRLEPMKQTLLNVPRYISGHGESICRRTPAELGAKHRHFSKLSPHRQGKSSISDGSGPNVAGVRRPIDSAPSIMSVSTLRLDDFLGSGRGKCSVLSLLFRSQIARNSHPSAGAQSVRHPSQAPSHDPVIPAVRSAFAWRMFAANTEKA